MDQRGDHHRHGCQQDDAAEQGVGGGEELRGAGGQEIHRTHPAQNHGGVKKCVDPWESGKAVVAQDSEAQRTTDNEDGEQKGAGESPQENAVWGELDAVLFSHAREG